MRNAMTVDVEDYFMVSAFSRQVPFGSWSRYESRVAGNTYRLLDRLEEAGVAGTFFVLGWVAEHHPEVVKEIARRGHEIACHSHSHRLVYDLSPEEFRLDTRKSKRILENLVGMEVSGYRAPSYSITKRSLWALEILAEEGFLYDSSIFPVRHDRYGYPDFHRFPVVIETRNGGRILEIPLSTVRILGSNVPVAGGGYFRLYPLSFTDFAIRSLNEREKKAAVVYLHPWEIDPAQPRLEGGLVSRMRHYVNIGKTEARLAAILKRHRFAPVRDVFADALSQATNNPEVIHCAYS